MGISMGSVVSRCHPGRPCDPLPLTEPPGYLRDPPSRQTVGTRHGTSAGQAHLHENQSADPAGLPPQPAIRSTRSIPVLPVFSVAPSRADGGRFTPPPLGGRPCPAARPGAVVGVRDLKNVMSPSTRAMKVVACLIILTEHWLCLILIVYHLRNKSSPIHRKMHAWFHKYCKERWEEVFLQVLFMCAEMPRIYSDLVLLQYPRPPL